MKKFLVFCVAIIVVVSICFMTVFFMSGGRIIAPDDISMKVDESVKVKFTTKDIERKMEYKVTCDNSNLLTVSVEDKVVTITSNNIAGTAYVYIQAKDKNIPQSFFKVEINDGSIEHPYIVNDAEGLKNMENNTHYELGGNINLSGEWTPLDEFNGTLDGRGYSIYYMSVTNSTSNAGLFSVIGQNGIVKNLNLSKANLNGNFESVGVLAGINKGVVSNVNVSDATINATSSAQVGGIVGQNTFSINGGNTKQAKMQRVSYNGSIIGDGNVGGIAGANIGGSIFASYVGSTSLKAITSTSNVGGIVGLNDYFIVGSFSTSYIGGSYSLATCTDIESVSNATFGGIVGKQNYNEVYAEKNKVYGCYYVKDTTWSADKCFATAIGGMADIENCKVTIDPEDSSKNIRKEINGVYGAEAKTLSDLTNKASYKLLLDDDLNTIIMWNFDEDGIWEEKVSGTPVFRNNFNTFDDYSYLLASKQFIDTFEKLKNIESNNVYYITNNIDCDNSVWESKDLDNVQLRGYNGNVYTISNFKLANNSNTGFFSNLRNSTIKDIKFANVSNVNIVNLDTNNTEYNYGVVAGKIENVNLTNVQVENASFVINEIPEMDNCTFRIGTLVGAVNGDSKLVACGSNNSKIETSYIKDNMEKASNIYVGGLVGVLDKGRISDSNVQDFNGKILGGYNSAMGGVVGLVKHTSIVEKCIVNTSTDDKSTNLETSTFYKGNKSGLFRGQYVGGVAGSVEADDANFVNINSVKVFANITGCIVGGVTGYTNSSINLVDTQSNLSGWKVGGVTGYQSGVGVISNCAIGGSLSTAGTFSMTPDSYTHDVSSSQKAGIACISYAGGDTNPKFVNCYIYATFNNQNGDCYADTACVISYSSSFGKSENVVYNSSISKNLKERYTNVGTKIYNFYEQIRGLDFDKKMNYVYSTNTNSAYKDIFKYGFDSQVWACNEGQNPYITKL